MSEATWHYSVNVGPTKALIVEPDGTTVMELRNVASNGDFERKVRRICRAVNTHDDMVKALGFALGSLTGGLDGEWPNHDTLTFIRETYARAKVQP